MATAADLKVGDRFILARDERWNHLVLPERWLGVSITVESIRQTQSTNYVHVGMKTGEETTSRTFAAEHPVTIIEQEQDMPAITTTAADLRVGDVFTVADLPDTSPLWMNRPYEQGTELTVTSIEPDRYTTRSRVIHFTGAPRDASKVFEPTHPVTIVRRRDDLSASALEAPAIVTDSDTITSGDLSGLYPALPYGTPVTFSPEAGIGPSGITTGTAEAAEWADGHWYYQIRLASGHFVHRYDNYGSESVVPTPESAPDEVSGPTPEAPRQVIPRTSEAAKAMLTIGADFLDADTIEALKRLALYLPGSRAEKGGMDLAVAKDLCIQYEIIVCPQLGWAPREQHARHLCESAKPERWLDEVEAFERANRGADAPSMIRGFAQRYARGGSVNRAITEHMSDHLEEYKVEPTNQVLDALGFDGLEQRDKNYQVTVRLERTRTVTEYAYVSYTTSASSADDAHEYVRDNIHMHSEAADQGVNWSEEYETVDYINETEEWSDSSVEKV